MDASYDIKCNFNEVFPNSVLEYIDENGKKHFCININKSLISNIKIGPYGDKVEVSFSNKVVGNMFTPYKCNLKAETGKEHFTLDYLNRQRGTIIAFIDEFMFNANRAFSDEVTIACHKEDINAYVDNLIHGIDVMLKKAGFPCDIF